MVNGALELSPFFGTTAEPVPAIPDDTDRTFAPLTDAAEAGASDETEEETEEETSDRFLFTAFAF
jgi:hypothetical protein